MELLVEITMRLEDAALILAERAFAGTQAKAPRVCSSRLLTFTFVGAARPALLTSFGDTLLNGAGQLFLAS
jgi:hypothetical protein